MTENYYCKKVSFATESDADFYIKKLKRTSKRAVVPMRAYLCEKCFNWHLTSLQSIDVFSVLSDLNESKINVSRLEKQLEKLQNKLTDRENTIACLNKAIIDFRTPKRRKK